MKVKKKLCMLILLLMGMLLCTACESEKQEEISSNQVYQIYYLNKEETRIDTVEYVPNKIGDVDIYEKIDELLEQLGTKVNGSDLKCPINETVSVRGCKYDSFRLELDFDESYYELEPIPEVLTRAAIVRTLTQIEDIDYIIFTVKGHLLTYTSGIPIGTMKADTFVDNAGVEISAMDTVKLVLFFANESKDKLVKITKTVDYNTNISLEKLVMEQLIAGPGNTADAYPVLSPDTKVVTVTTRDGVCYVNFDSSFLNQIYSVSPEVVIYSITNSLIELPKINKVQITVDGENDRVFRDTITLKNVFERNLNLVE